MNMIDIFKAFKVVPVNELVFRGEGLQEAIELQERIYRLPSAGMATLRTATALRLVKTGLKGIDWIYVFPDGEMPSGTVGG